VRAGALAARFDDRAVDALLVTARLNVRYLSGFSGTSGCCLVTPDARILVTDFRYVEQAAEQASGWDVRRGERELTEAVAGIVSEAGIERLGFEDQHMSVRTHRRLGGLLGDTRELIACGGLVEELRAVKDQAELAAVGAAARLADEALRRVLERGLAGRTESEVAATLELEMRALGAERVSFPPIVAAGAHGALPHAQPRDVTIPADTLVVVDFGCELDGYCSDCTRTFATGDPGAEEREVYRLVLEAQVAALEAVRPGASCPDVDAVARSLIEGAGHGDKFGHGLGHGVGLEIHEEPRLARTAEGELAAGNVVTVEPGVYLPGRFGVRIEDLVAVTEDGHDVLSGLPKELTVVDG
jgi:Xaa-Pro aminopeptidase